MRRRRVQILSLCANKKRTSKRCPVGDGGRGIRYAKIFAYCLQASLTQSRSNANPILLSKMLRRGGFESTPHQNKKHPQGVLLTGIFNRVEDARALRLKSELFELRAEHANPILLSKMLRRGGFESTPHQNKKHPQGVLLFWRKRWDSNPRTLAGQLISSQSRYDHFDTLPYNVIFVASRQEIMQSKTLE